MYNKIILKIKVFITKLKQASSQFKKQYAFELKNISTCPQTTKHLIEVKVNGKGQSISCLVEEIASDNDFIAGFSPADIRTIAYLAVCDKYEKILREEKIKKAYEIIRPKSIDNKKTITIRNKITGEFFFKCIQSFSDQQLIDDLDSMDAYYIGYLAGQEQTFRDVARLRSLKTQTYNENTS